MVETPKGNLSEFMRHFNISYTVGFNRRHHRADKGYATGLFVHWLLEQEVQPHVPIMDARGRNEKGIYPIEQFLYDEEKDQFICPQGTQLQYWGSSQAQ
jgi:hypothetical protein